MTLQYVVAFQHPYYPEIALCETMEQAQKRAVEWRTESEVAAGDNEGYVVVAEVKSLINFLVDY